MSSTDNHYEEGRVENVIIAHDDPVIVGLRSTEEVYYAFCRQCGAYTAIRPDPELALDELLAGPPQRKITLQPWLPLIPATPAADRPPEGEAA